MRLFARASFAAGLRNASADRAAVLRFATGIQRRSLRVIHAAAHARGNRKSVRHFPGRIHGKGHSLLFVRHARRLRLYDLCVPPLCLHYMRFSGKTQDGKALRLILFSNENGTRYEANFSFWLTGMERGVAALR